MLPIEYLLSKCTLIIEYIVRILDLSDIQLTLIREFGLILIGNCILICIAWIIYGSRISRKFWNSKNTTIETLRMSQIEFQLPREHDFKFK